MSPYDISKTNLTIDPKISSPNPIVNNEKEISVVELKLKILQMKREELELELQILEEKEKNI